MENVIHYSLVLLKEAVVVEPKEKADYKLFQESVIVMELDAELLENYAALIEYIYEMIDRDGPDYGTYAGEKIEWKLVKIIDIWEPRDRVEVLDEYAEVYCRYLEMPGESTVDDVVNKYYSGFAYERY